MLCSQVDNINDMLANAFSMETFLIIWILEAHKNETNRYQRQSFCKDQFKSVIYW